MASLFNSTITLFLLFSLFFLAVTEDADESLPVEHFPSQNNDGFSSLQLEFEQLQNKINLLETRLVESNAKLKAKDEKISQLDNIIKEKADIVASLKVKIENIQQRGTSDAEERVGKAHARASELQKKVEKLKIEIEEQIKEKDTLEARANAAEKKIEELSSKLDKLQKINAEQKIIIRKTERALQVAEEEMMKAKLEASSRSNDLMEVHGAWLPPWLLYHLIHTQSFIVAEWNEHGKPVMDVLLQKTLERKGQVEKWAEPHIETIKTKWVPPVKDHWVVITEYVELHMKSLTAKTGELYDSSKTAIKPHIIKVKGLAEPYYQEAKRFSKPYIDQVATSAKPHVEKARLAFKPYTKKAVHICRNFLESATMYHRQVQAAIHNKLKQHELTSPLATKELVWFLASALLALPVIVLSKACSALFCTRSTKYTRHSHSHSQHGRRKGKRSHSEK